MKLTPQEKHRDTRAELEVPLAKAGGWWVTGKIDGGNSFHTLVWIVDSVLVQHDVGGKKQWWVAEAASGAPVAGAAIQFFGYRRRPVGTQKAAGAEHGRPHQGIFQDDR